MTKSPFIRCGERATELLGLIHTYVCGPMEIQARGGYSYFITSTDDMSRYGFVYIMKHKSESFEMFKRFRSEVEKHTGKSIKVLRFIGYPKEIMGYYFYHPSDHKVFVAKRATFLEREFLLEGNCSRKIELDEVKETNESTQYQDHETQVEEPLLDILKLISKLTSSTVEVQELNVVQEQVNEPVPYQIEQQPNPT
ncbi:uncharacterized protein [Nicotiana tomentosiformis]|uniref:uncharacterized protein n=1 Tax=Nicotiana tomentosiformis TaxID=4098 RepID=UPI00388C7295